VSLVTDSDVALFSITCPLVYKWTELSVLVGDSPPIGARSTHEVIFHHFVLIACKTFSPVFQYWTIVPLEHLLARLAVDSESVCKRIINLIFNNFVPIDASSELGHCINKYPR